MNSSLHNLSQWLENTSLSSAVRDIQFMVPLLQSIHIFAVALVIWSALAIDLRVLGALGREQPLAAFSQRFLPVMWWTLIVLLISGALLIVGEPHRTLQNPVFQLKMVVLLLGMLVTALVQSFMATGKLALMPKAGDAAVKALAVLSIGAWVVVIFAGRWIAYTSS